MTVKPMTPLPLLVCEEALDALLIRVRWYSLRRYGDKSVPERLKLAFNYLCGVLDKPDAPPYRRIK